MMHMTFWFGDIGEFFFHGFVIDDAAKTAGLCTFIFLLSILYEGLKVRAAYSKAKAAREHKRASSCAPSENAMLLSAEQNSTPQQSFLKKIIRGMNECFTFLFHNALGYALMLTVMSYNLWLLISVVGGLSIGYFLFGHLSMRINMENIQAIQTQLMCTPRCPNTDPYVAGNPSGAAEATSPSTTLRNFGQDGASSSRASCH